MLSGLVHVSAAPVPPLNLPGWEFVCKLKGKQNCNNPQSQPIGPCQEIDSCANGGCYYMSKANSRRHATILYWGCVSWPVNVPDWWGYCGGGPARDCQNVQPHVHTSPTAAVSACDILRNRGQGCGMPVIQTGRCACVQFSLGGSPPDPTRLCWNSYDCWSSGLGGCKVRYNGESCTCRNHICKRAGDAQVQNQTSATIDPCDCLSGGACAMNANSTLPLTNGYCYCWKDP